MEKLLIIDAGNYDPTLPEICRTAIRGIIFSEKKILLVRSAAGDIKFPGGGQEDGEKDPDTLTREIAEETGCTVETGSIQAFGEVEEKRLSTEGAIWHQTSRYYLCQIIKERGPCHYTENEKRQGFYPEWYSLDEAINIGQEMLDQKGLSLPSQRDFAVLKLLAERAALPYK